MTGVASKNRSPGMGDAFGPLELELKQQEDSFAPGQGGMHVCSHLMQATKTGFITMTVDPSFAAFS